MKPHFIIVLRASAPIYNLPHWEELIFDKSKQSDQFLPEVIRLVREHGGEYLYTSEYHKKNEEWSQEEKDAGLHRTYRIISIGSDRIPGALLSSIRALPAVESVFGGHIGIADIPQVSEGMSLRQRHPGDLIGLETVHMLTKGDSRVRIAVLDTGVDSEHPEIRHAMERGKDFVHILDGASRFIGDFLDMDDDPFDEVGHGTHVSGILAAKGEKMPVGVAPLCKILPVRVLGALQNGDQVVGAGLIDNINNGIKWAVDQKVNVINMSLGIKHLGGGLPHAQVIRYALSKGVSIVAASGNDGSNDKYYPGALPGVVAVGAAVNDRSVARFSTYGNHIGFISPGTDIYSCMPRGGYSVASGTSQASPFVSGAFALMISYAISNGKHLTDRHIKYYLSRTSDRIGSGWKDVRAGYGLINLIDCIKLMQYHLN